MFLTHANIFGMGQPMLNIVIWWACQHNMFVEVVTVQSKSNIYALAVRGGKNMCICFDENDYDFSKYTVHKCSGNVNISEGTHYICMNCHKSLLATNDDNLLVPYYMKRVLSGQELIFLLPTKKFQNMYACVVIGCCFKKLSGHFQFLTTMSAMKLLKNVCLITLLWDIPGNMIWEIIQKTMPIGGL